MKIQTTNVIVQVPRDNNRKGAMFLIGRVIAPCHLEAATGGV
jgi:hypothetical protein